MKYVIAIVQPERVNDVLDQLEEKSIHLVTVTNVMGRGRQKGLAETYRGLKAVSSLLQKVKLEIAVNDDYVDQTVDAITTGARSESIGDGKIFVMDLADCIRIRTGESGAVAIG